MKTLSLLLSLGLAVALLGPRGARAEGQKSVILVLLVTGDPGEALRRPKTKAEKVAAKKAGEKVEKQDPSPDWNLLELKVKPWLEKKGYQVLPRLEKEDQEVALLQGSLELVRRKRRFGSKSEVFDGIFSARWVARTGRIERIIQLNESGSLEEIQEEILSALFEDLESTFASAEFKAHRCELRVVGLPIAEHAGMRRALEGLSDVKELVAREVEGEVATWEVHSPLECGALAAKLDGTTLLDHLLSVSAVSETVLELTLP